MIRENNFIRPADIQASQSVKKKIWIFELYMSDESDSSESEAIVVHKHQWRSESKHFIILSYIMSNWVHYYSRSKQN